MFKFMDGWFTVWRAVLSILKQRVAVAEAALKARKEKIQREHDEHVARLLSLAESEKEAALKDEVAQIFKGV